MSTDDQTRNAAPGHWPMAPFDPPTAPGEAPLAVTDEPTSRVSDWDYEPECPYCHTPMYDAWEHALDDGDHVETECGSCEKPLTITASVSVEYKLSPV